MAYTFVLHKGESQEHDGWHESNELVEGRTNESGIASIQDMGAGVNEGKIGTSIPTPLARVYLFDAAFKFVNAEGVSSEPNNYDKLVSHTLDFFQFLFEHGGESDKFEFIQWRGIESAEELYAKKVNDGHVLLSAALNMAVKGTPFEGCGITLIKYDNMLIGGTSPMTVLYTSPNIARLLSENRRPILANDKSKLFSESLSDVKHLKERASSFKKYMRWLLKENSTLIDADDSVLRDFFGYIDKQTEDVESCTGEYFCDICDADSIALKAAGIKLKFDQTPLDLQASDFMMAPNRAKVFGENRIAPLVLPVEDGGKDCIDWKYLSDSEPWNSRTQVDYSQIDETPVEQRKLPINGAYNKFSSHIHAWVTNSDFFEDHLVDLGYEIDMEHYSFHEINGFPSRYLLPIKKEYFNYFSCDDLYKYLSFIVKEKDANNTPETIEAILQIPLKNGKNIALKRSYSTLKGSSFKIISDAKNFAMGIFPFYRLADQKLKNQYSVYMYGDAAAVNDIKIGFFRKDFGKSIAEGQVFDVDTINNSTCRGDGVLRTKDEDSFSKVFNLRAVGPDNSFDIVTVKVGNGLDSASGIVIPKWQDVSQVIRDKESIFAIDFGTSNTYISYLDGSEAKPFTINPEDQQMVLLNKNAIDETNQKRLYYSEKAFGGNVKAASYMREFVPSLIGNDVVSKSELVTYPIKTATLEKANLGDGDGLFTGLNIGYLIDVEQQDYNHSNFVYTTNLKWRAEDSKIRNGIIDKNDILRVKAFCEQTLWMIKNKIIQNGFDREKIEIIYFYPDSMSAEVREMFEDIWNEAKSKVFDDCGFGDVTIRAELEAVAPYYALLKNNNDLYTCTSANIDVGGGTTDIFILDRHTNRLSEGIDGFAYESSVMFAGNDIWGANCLEADAHNESNGFVTMMEHDLSPSAKAKYEKVSNKKIMSEVVSFFFKNDDEFQFSERVRSYSGLKYILFIHYAAIIKYFTDILKAIRKENPDFVFPKILNFTGKGSDYIKLIASSSKLDKQTEEISNLTYDLFQSFGIDVENEFKEGFDVKFVNNPKALTADGGVSELLMNRGAEGNAINIFDKEKAERSSRRSTTQATDSRMQVPYYRIGKKCLGFELESGEAITIGDTDSLKMRVLNSFDIFVETVFSVQYQNLLSVKISGDEIADFKSMANNSFDVYVKRFMAKNKSKFADPLTENIFFFTLKNTLVDYSKIVAKNLIKK